MKHLQFLRLWSYYCKNRVCVIPTGNKLQSTDLPASEQLFFLLFIFCNLFLSLLGFILVAHCFIFALVFVRYSVAFYILKLDFIQHTNLPQYLLICSQYLVTFAWACIKFYLHFWVAKHLYRWTKPSSCPTCFFKNVFSIVFISFIFRFALLQIGG